VSLLVKLKQPALAVTNPRCERRSIDSADERRMDSAEERCMDSAEER
jgi:hypothetical protein